MSLLSLPTELLKLIVDSYLDGPDPLPSALSTTCTRLYELVRARVFRTLDYGSNASKNSQLKTILQQRSEVCKVVRRLQIICQQVPDADVATQHDAGALLCRLPALEMLWIVARSSTELCDIFDQPAEARLPPIRWLKIQLARDEESHHDDLGWWNALSRWMSLQSLVLESEFEGWEPSALALDPQKLPQALASVRHLTFDLSAFSGPQVPALRDLFPSLETLEIFVSGEAQSPGVSSLRAAPSSLKVLTVHNQAFAGTQLDLGRFKSLRSLRLVGKVDLEGLPPALASLPSLEMLRFDGSSNITDKLLLNLIEGPTLTRLEQLRSLHLHHVPLKIKNRKFSSKEIVRELDCGRSFDTIKDEYRPKWPAGWSERSILEVLEAGRRRNVKIVGPAAARLEWDRRFDAKVAQVLYQHTEDTGDRTLIERVFGKERAEQVIRQHGVAPPTSAAAV